MPKGEYSHTDARDACWNSKIGGYRDWRLPTESELAVLCALKSQIGGFIQDCYWSSSYDRYNYQYELVNFSEGQDCYQGRASEYSSYRVRAVRTITE